MDRTSSAPLMRILIVKLSAIGDVVQALPAVEAIRRSHPGSEITWVVEEAAAGILEGHPAIDRLLVSRRKAWLRMVRNPRRAGAALREMREFLRSLRRHRYDIAIDLQGLLKSGVVIGLSRAARKIGFAGTRELSFCFLNERLPPYDIERHALLRYLDVAAYLGARHPSPSCTLPIGPEVARMRERLRAALPAGRLFVALNPVARWKTKLWPERNFAALADRLVRERSASVIFTGAPGDRQTIDRIIALMDESALNWAGETTLKELAALASLADLFVTTDTGPMHVAAAAGARVLALFGPTAPWRTGPFGVGQRALRTGIPCAPCFRRTCTRRTRCMEEITVERVLASARLNLLPRREVNEAASRR